jgi:hypothetical protein
MKPPEFEILPDDDPLPATIVIDSACGRGRVAVLKIFGDLTRGFAALEGAPEIKSLWPVYCEQQRCGFTYEFVGPDDFPLDTLYCKCGDAECVVVLWK